jgi:hypothetical protein
VRAAAQAHCTEVGLEPRRTFLHATGVPLGRAFIVAGTESGPGNQVTGGFKAAHIDTDLGDDHLGGE